MAANYREVMSSAVPTFCIRCYKAADASPSGGADIYTMSHTGQGWPATIAAGFSRTNALPTASPSIPAATCRAFYNIGGRESNPYASHPTCDHVSLKW
jgi:hypothetical protein